MATHILTRSDGGAARFFLTLSYRGAPFHGWQVQPGAVSVQEVIEDALMKLTGSRVAVTGAGRTDAGVNARMMVAHADIPSVNMSADALLRGYSSPFGYSCPLRRARPLRCDVAHLPLLCDRAQESFFSLAVVAVWFPARFRGHERSRGDSPRRERFCFVRQAAFRRPHDYMPRQPRMLDPRLPSSRSVVFRDNGRPVPAQHGACSGGYARRGRTWETVA